MDQQQDIRAEYERIFGAIDYPTLFGPDDEEYNALRQEIIEAQPEKFSTNDLPFRSIYSVVAPPNKAVKVERSLIDEELDRIFGPIDLDPPSTRNSRPWDEDLPF